ncbi:MAG: hypothetical protein WB538_12725, partial [Candidatus Sulfotelmatobacter sp.]
SRPYGILSRMEMNPRSRIQELCAQAMAATDTGQIEPILSQLRAALHDKVQSGENLDGALRTRRS